MPRTHKKYTRRAASPISTPHPFPFLSRASRQQHSHNSNTALSGSGTQVCERESTPSSKTQVEGQENQKPNLCEGGELVQPRKLGRREPRRDGSHDVHALGSFKIDWFRVVGKKLNYRAGAIVFQRRRGQGRREGGGIVRERYMDNGKACWARPQ